MSDTTDLSESGRDVDADEGNWLARNLWMLKGLVVAGSFVAFGVASFVYFENELANVLWAIGVTVAAMVILGEIAFGVFQAVNSA